MMKVVFLIFAVICCKSFADKRVVCYYASWSAYRQDPAKMNIEDIDPNICTHLIYSFVGLGDDSKIKVLDPWQDLADGGGKDGFRRFTNLKNGNPKLKVLVAIGGWNEGSTKYSQLLGNPQNRKTFVQDAVDFLKKYNFDGLDLDWEYPTKRSGVPADKNTFSFWCKELREEFKQHGFLVSAAIGASESLHSEAYDIPEISRHLDFINVMTYDYHDSSFSKTSHNSPLHSSSGNADNSNIEKSIKSLLERGAPSEKINLGIGTYGKTFTLSSTSCTNPGCAASGAGAAGQYINEAGTMGYNEICLKEQEVKPLWDNEAMVPYMVDGNRWISYDNLQSVKHKIDFVNEMNLGGAMVWTIDTDDFKDSCNHGKYPLISMIRASVGKLPTKCLDCPNQTQVNSQSTKTQKITASTTTTQSNIAQTNTLGTTPSPTDICKHEGYNRDISNCSVFHLCVAKDQGWTSFRYQCGEGLYFDTDNNVCNFKHLVSIPTSERCN